MESPKENNHEAMEVLRIGDMIFLPAYLHSGHVGKYAVPGQVRSRHGLTYEQKYAELAWIMALAKKLGKPLQRVKPPRWE